MTAYLILHILLAYLSALYHGQSLHHHRYGDASTLNSGIIVIVGEPDDSVFNPSCGYELRGTKGWFCNVE